MEQCENYGHECQQLEEVRQDTLREVGEWLEKRYWSERDTMLTFDDIEDLKYGELPKE